MNKMTIDDLDCEGKKVLMRVDFNVPLKDGEIVNDTRIQAALPSIKTVLSKGASLVLMSHLGRPKGEKDKGLSLSPCAKRLGELLKKKVKMAPDCVGQEVSSMVHELKKGEILLLENLRFHPAEKQPEIDPDFVKELASYGDFYVNDAFGTCHRKHASVFTITEYFLGKAALGKLLEKELRILGELMQKPKRPSIAIIGGVKISTKIGILDSLIEKIDVLVVGGAMACTFLRAAGYSMGDSIVEEDQIPAANRVREKCASAGVRLLLPTDLVIADEIDEKAKTHLIFLENEGVQKGWRVVDIGPATIEEYSRTLKGAETIFWNGPLGIFEVPSFAVGTYAVAELLAKSKGVTVVGGGDSLAAISQLGLEDKMTHLSTGGGASLKLIETGSLPAIDVLSEKHISHFMF